jgi:hypothetical protein
LPACADTLAIINMPYSTLRPIRLSLGLMTVLSGLLLTAAARAESVEVCSDAYTKAQEERLAGRLMRARALLQTCQEPSCPEVIVNDCSRWLAEVEADLPSVRISTRDRSGSPVEGASAQLDGRALSADELAAALILDPGPHQLRVVAPGFKARELEVSLSPEDRDRRVDVRLERQPPAVVAPASRPEPQSVTEQPEAPRTSTSFPVAATVLAGTGVVALGASIYFGISAKSKYDDLETRCAPDCASGDIDAVQTRALLSDLSLATSLIAFGGAAWLYWREPASKPTTARLGLAPTLGGGKLRLRVDF